MSGMDASATINASHVGTWAADLGLTLTSATRDEVRATIALRSNHRTPHGLVHGGVHSAIVETVASIGAGLDALAKGKRIVGLENSTSFVRAVREGVLRAIAKPITRGRRTQLWDVMIENDEGAIVATGRVRLLVLDAEVEVAGGTLDLAEAEKPSP
jgi:1,4-dihydroxy-2-naphthoyl-CoA hydrolase